MNNNNYQVPQGGNGTFGTPRVPQPMMSATEAIKKVLTSPTDFAGRSRRSELWWFVLFFFVCNQLVSSLFTRWLGPTMGMGAQYAVTIALALPMTAVQVRRLHDAGHGGWAAWVFLAINIAYYTIALFALEPVMEIAADPFNQRLMMRLMKEHGSEIMLLSVTSLAYVAWGLVMLIFNVQDSDMGTNRYGESPKYK